MASSTGLGQLGSFLGVVGCFIVVLQACTASKPLLSAPPTFETVKVSELPLPPSGILGLSPLIQPIKQYIFLAVDYPNSYYNQLHERASYRAKANISLRCVQPTKRITVNANPEWNLLNLRVGSSTGNLADTVYFNPADETLIVDLVVNLDVGVTYDLYVDVASALIDEDDRFGIQMFNRTRQDTGDVLMAASLSGEIQVMRRLIPCFDDPAYMIPYTWRVDATYGTYSPAIAMMNGPRSSVEHRCHWDDPSKMYSVYLFDFPAMAIEATQLRIVPFSWYPQNIQVTLIPPECF